MILRSLSIVLRSSNDSAITIPIVVKSKETDVFAVDVDAIFAPV